MSDNANGGIFKLKNARLAFADGIFNAKENTNDQGKVTRSFGCKFILPRNHPQLEDLKSLIGTVAKNKWGEKAKDVLKVLVANHKICLLDGDLKEWDGFAGNMFVSAGGKNRPLVVDADPNRILTEADGRPYSGCYVNASIEVWAQENKHGKRINAQLRGVQFVRDGDAFGGGAPARPEEFDNVESEGADAAPPESGEQDFSDFI
jgi:hypothetical protein